MAERPVEFKFEGQDLDMAEQYLADRDERSRLSVSRQGLKAGLENLMARDSAYNTMLKGMAALIKLLQQLHQFVFLEAIVSNVGYKAQRNKILDLMENTALSTLLNEHAGGRLGQDKAAEYDGILRFKCYPLIRELLDQVYYLDVYLSMAALALKKGYVFAEALESNDTQPSLLEIEEVIHPSVSNAKGNNLQMDRESNVLFLTGANMAGKSTFMKSVGIALYLAQAGLPVPAKQMKWVVLDGLYTTINLPDNLGMGASHFYAEVLRVKKVATELKAGKRLFVMFDELFRGTNVKDAGEATIEVVAGFARKANSLFVVSTHIMEAGEALRQRNLSIQYRFLPTRMEAHTPVYTYQLTEGITEDRHGMIIIANEGILDILTKGKKDQKSAV